MGRYNKTKPHVVIDLFSTYRLSPKIRLDTNDDMELSYLTPSKPNQIPVSYTHLAGDDRSCYKAADNAAKRAAYAKNRKCDASLGGMKPRGVDLG